MAKIHKSEQEVREIIYKATDALVDFVKTTYGPASNKIIIQKRNHAETIDDGVETARNFELNDECENAVISIIREVAQKTNDRVGDGTTSSLIMLQAIMSEIRKLDKIVARTIVDDLENGLEEFKKQIKEKARQITSKEDLQKVAFISFNNLKLAEIIAEILFELGPEGIVTIEESRSMETTYNIVKGLQFPRGFASSYFINDHAKAECVLEKPYILVTDQEIYDPKDLVPIMNKVIATGNRQLVVLGDDVRGEALGTLVLNFVKGVGLFPAVRAPYHSNDKYEFLQDVAELTGANFRVSHTNKKLDQLELEDLGVADKVVLTKDHTTIIGGHGKEIEPYITTLKAMIESSDSELRKDKMKERLAKLTSGVAVIKVGGATENEMKALRYKVEDAVNATKVAFKSGVVTGAGVTLGSIITSSEILNKALKYPHEQLLKNWEVESIEIKEGVVDPVEVLIAGVESAISIASLLISTKGILVEKEEPFNEQK